MNNIDYTQPQYHNWPGRDMTPEVSLYYTAADGSRHRADAYPWPYTAGEWALAGFLSLAFCVICVLFFIVIPQAITERLERPRSS